MSVQCPSCSLFITDREQQTGKCPICDYEFPQPDFDPEVTAQEDAKAGSGVSVPQTRELKTRELSFLHKGLSLVYWGIILFLLSLLVNLFSGLEFSSSVEKIASGMQMVSIGLTFIGKVLCLKASHQTGGKGFILSSIVLDLLVLAIALCAMNPIWLISLGIPFNLMLLAWTMLVSFLIQIISFILFLFYLRVLALNAKREDLSGEVTIVLSLGLAVTPAVIGSFYLLTVNLLYGGIGLLIVSFLSVFYVYRYLRLLTKLEEAL